MRYVIKENKINRNLYDLIDCKSGEVISTNQIDIIIKIAIANNGTAQAEDYERRQFAAMALQGILSCQTIFGNPNGAVAKQAVMEADKLIEELNK